MLTAWGMANKNAKSRLSSGRLDADVDLLTCLASLISSHTFKDLVFRRSLLDNLHRILQRVYLRRGGRCETTRTGDDQKYQFLQRDVPLCEAFVVGACTLKDETMQSLSWKRKDALRRVDHMAASWATFQQRVAFACALSGTRLLLHK
jgi:hypothetical protein